ncbi:MAG: glycoside hydrolase family 20 zincin-like fold domain-containing protein [Bacteroidota bacterium]
MNALIIFIVALPAVLFSQEIPAPVPDIIPTPQEVKPGAGKFRITSSTKIILGTGATAEDEYAAEQVNEYLAELKDVQLRTVREKSVRNISANHVFIGPPNGEFARRFLKDRKINLTSEMKSEGYALICTRDGIVIVGESAAGRFYGVMSLLQMIRGEKKSLTVAGISIRDWPQQSFRGISDDLSRGQVSTPVNFRKIIRFLARHKLNVYSPYIEDIFVFKNHPLIGKNRGALTAAEVKDLDAYAKKYHVEMVPIFETLGHWENILAMPEYVGYAEFPGAHTVNVSDEAAYRLLDEMIGELASAFSSPWFNMAADESWDVGLGANKARVAASDLATVHAEHYRRVFDILARHKKKPMMYGDIILKNPTILEKIPHNVVMVDWHYDVQSNYPSPEVFKAAGFPFVVSPAVWNFTGPFPNYINTFVNIENLNRDGFENGSTGLLTSTWNDYGGEELRELNYYGYAWTAECAWRPMGADLQKFNEKFFASFFGSEAVATPAQAAYAILSDPLNQVNWNDLWRHPMLPLRPSPLNPLWRIQSIESTMPLVQKLLDAVGAGARRNRDHLEYLRFVTKLNLWYAKKLKAGESVRLLTQDVPISASRDSVRDAALGLMDRIVPDLLALKDEFKARWLATNRPENLEWLLMRYDRQAAYWQEKAEELHRNALWVDPIIESQWIYHPLANPWMRDSSLTQVPRAYFWKSFNLTEPPVNGKLQLIGDTHARVWLNGESVGEVYARRSLSLTVEYQRVKIWEMAKFLKKGENVIAVEAANYNTFGSAGENILVEIPVPGGTTVRIPTDSTWKVSDKVSEGWFGAAAVDSTWVSAKPVPYPLPVVRPNFSTGRGSWIER